MRTFPVDPKQKFRIPQDLPPFRASNFVGRDSDLEKLQYLRRTIGGQGIIQVCGVGGIGKTQLVLEYCHRCSSTYDSVFWISASNTFSMLNSMFNIARQIRDFYKSSNDVADV